MCKSSTGPRWWSTHGPCPTRSPSPGSRSCWPVGTLFKPSCWSVCCQHTDVSAHLSLPFFFFFFYTAFLFPHLFFRLVQMDPTQWCDRDWGFPPSSGIMTSLLWLQCCTCQRWVLCSPHAASLHACSVLFFFTFYFFLIRRIIKGMHNRNFFQPVSFIIYFIVWKKASNL